MAEEKRPDERLAPHPRLSNYYRHDKDRAQFVRRLFDAAARDYDRIERGMALGGGRWYRREALRRAGLVEGMRVLDVAIGTGLVAREAVRLVGDPSRVFGLDPSTGMLTQARRELSVHCVLGVGEQLPWRSGTFDLLSLGYALRHLSDLSVTFNEFARVLKPGATLCVLELTRPANRFGFAALRCYLRYVVPLLARLRTRNNEAELLMRYFWDTIEACIPSERILAALDEAGFVDVRRTVAIGMFSEYTGHTPGPRAPELAQLAKPERNNFFVRRMER